MEFNGEIYAFKQQEDGTISETLVLTSDNEITVLKISGKKSFEQEILPHLNMNLPEAYCDRIPKLLSAGKTQVDWNGVLKYNLQKYSRTDWYYVHLSYLPGIPLNRCISEIRPFRKEIVKSILNLIAEINRFGVLHMDIRAENVIINDKVPSLIDFGESQFIQSLDSVYELDELDDIYDIMICFIRYPERMSILDDFDQLERNNLEVDLKIMTQIVDKYL